ncbi:MAG: hypothetical protein ACNA7V_11860 [Bacteroidales bacterium]
MKSKFYLTSMSRTGNWFALLVAALFTATLSNAQVAINADNSAPHASAMLEVKATGLGLLAPRMTFAQRPVSPATGLIIYQTNNDPGYYYYDGAEWQKVGRAVDSHWTKVGNDIYYHTGNVSVGVTDPENHGMYVQNYVSGKAAVRGTDQVSTTIFADGMLGVLEPYLLGIPTTVYNAGVVGIKPAVGFNGAAVLGWNNDVNSENYAGYFVTNGASSGTNYGLYAESVNATVTNYAGFFKGRMYVDGHATGSDATGNVIQAQVNHTLFSDTRAVYGRSIPQNGYGYGVYGEGGWRGVHGWANSGDYSGTSYGVSGSATGSAGTRIGIYGTASGGTTNWAGYFVGSAYISSNLRIGTTTQATGYALSVNGKIIATEVRVEAFSNWPDYVFAEDYKLMSLEELEQSINENQHLPGIPSAQEVSETGFDLGDMQRRLLEKVEELTLYTIQQEKMIKELQQEIKSMKIAE